MEMDQDGLRFRVKFKRKNPQAKENIQARTTVAHIREFPRIQLFESSAKYEASPKAGGPKHCLLFPKQQSRNELCIQPPYIMQPVSLYDKHGQ